MDSESDETPVLMDIDPIFDPDSLGWKEIGNLASWTVSTCKPGCGVEALRDDDTTLFWQYVFPTTISDISYQILTSLSHQIRRSSTPSSEHSLLPARIHNIHPYISRL